MAIAPATITATRWPWARLLLHTYARLWPRCAVTTPTEVYTLVDPGYAAVIEAFGWRHQQFHYEGDDFADDSVNARRSKNRPQHAA